MKVRVKKKRDEDDQGRDREKKGETIPMWETSASDRRCVESQGLMERREEGERSRKEEEITLCEGARG
ncbi:Hypothetical protein SMAX5B_009206 [Scophthalmus maximus]|uniref:Uncharacterized protein n=1 Tax=Scophthalmus maximus TaxID=52904 RepID=A0A2U9C286_SCOMX|nr:Hypothetical protein SMAX5B_009206 [Scophthalmus maximus]